MRLVVLESPYAGKTAQEIERNVRYLRACMHDCFKRGDIPFASHGLYTQPGVLRDDVPEERKLGIEGGLLWGSKAEAACIYTDLGVTPGMELGIVRHEKEGRPVEKHSLGPDWDKDFPSGVGDDDHVTLGVYKVRLCPNPGCENPKKIEFSDPAEEPAVVCESCGMRGPKVPDDMPHAIDLWNALPRLIN